VSIDAERGPGASRRPDQPSSGLEQAELRKALPPGLGRLLPDHRVAIVLRDVEGLSTQEAAQIAGCSQAAFQKPA